MRIPGFALLLGLAVGCGDSNIPAASDAATSPDVFVAPCEEEHVETLLGAIPGVTSVTRESCQGQLRGAATCFALTMQQPVYPLAASGPTFPQRIHLAHRGCDAPTIIADWGYASFGYFDDELSALYEANTLWVEHRFQGESVPEAYNWDWTALTIENGANDLHRIVASFRPFYRGRWISTGASKGGITALYHAYFFPDDLDGTVPYVAPASRQRIDPIYQQYLDASLPNPCAQNLRSLQIAALTTRREAMLARITANIGASGFEDYYLEALVANIDWGFWQTLGVEACDTVPTTSASDDEVWQFIYDFYGSSGAAPAAEDAKSDGALYYEWLTEQGFALQIGGHIAQLLQLPDANPTMEQQFRFNYPGVTLPAYNGAVTLAARAWARDHAENLVLIYGQYDPWSGGAIEQPKKPTSARYFVPGASHGAAISSLPPDERAAALAHISRMLGTEPTGGVNVARAAARHRDALVGAALRKVSARPSTPSAAR